MAGRDVIHEGGTDIYDVYISSAEGLLELCSMGAGTINNPIWAVGSIEVNVYLTQDIDMSETAQQFIPPNDKDLTCFDGQGYRILNINIENKINGWTFFRIIGSIRNLKFQNFDISVISGDVYLFGRVSGTGISAYNVHGEGNITASSGSVMCLPVSYQYGKTIKKCSFNGNIKAITVYICRRSNTIYANNEGGFFNCFVGGNFECTSLIFGQSEQSVSYPGRPQLFNCFCIVEVNWSRLSNVYFTDTGINNYFYLLNQSQMTRNLIVQESNNTLLNSYVIVENNSRLSASISNIVRAPEFIMSRTTLWNSGWAI